MTQVTENFVRCLLILELYMRVYDRCLQRSSPKPHGQWMLYFMWSLHGKGDESLYK